MTTRDFIEEHLVEYKALCKGYKEYERSMYRKVLDNATMHILTPADIVAKQLEFAYRHAISHVFTPDFMEHYLPYHQLVKIINEIENGNNQHDTAQL